MLVLQEIVKTKNYGNAIIIGSGDKYGYLKVKFMDTGNMCDFRKDAVFSGEIRDKYAKTVVGVGIIGNVKTRGKNKKLYNVWKNMICRCYDGNNLAYFGKVFVVENWKTFENFLLDVYNVEGWNEKLFEESKIVLDKDIKQRFKHPKIYSKETCIWVYRKENDGIQDAQQNLFIAESPDGKRYVESNITKFAREHGLERRQISATLHKRFKTTMGWKFNYVNEEIV